MTVEQIKAEMKRVKSALYKEEVKSAMFAAIFGMNVACVFVMPFTFLTFLNVIAAFYVVGLFKPTIKKQEYLHSVMNGLKKALDNIQNPPKPPEPPKPSSPWRT